MPLKISDLGELNRGTNVQIASMPFKMSELEELNRATKMQASNPLNISELGELNCANVHVFHTFKEYVYIEE